MRSMFETDHDSVIWNPDGSVTWVWDTGTESGRKEIPAGTDFADHFESCGREDIAEVFRTDVPSIYGK